MHKCAGSQVYDFAQTSASGSHDTLRPEIVLQPLHRIARSGQLALNADHIAAD
jgi:hypothetical protein